MLRTVLSNRSRFYLKLDWLRLKARVFGSYRNIKPSSEKLHLGCGQRKILGWLNVDLVKSDYDTDLASGLLPWPDNSFSAIVSQQVIEHLDLKHELIPLIKELYRCCSPNGEIWLSCPDMEKVCLSYLQDKGISLLEDRNSRYPTELLPGQPPQQLINILFHQSGEHKNLFDFELISWLLQSCKFTNVIKVCEKDLLIRFPDFPARNDDKVALYVRAEKI